MLAVINAQHVNNDLSSLRTKCDNKLVQNLLRWDKADAQAYYQFTGASLSPILSRLDQLLSSLEGCSIGDDNRLMAELIELIERTYY